MSQKTISKIEKFFLYLPTIITLLLIIIIDKLEVTSFVNNNFENIEEVLEFLPTGIQIIMGIFAVIPIFYLGKIHDYRKEIIQQQSKFLSLINPKTSKENLDKIHKEISWSENVLHLHSRIRYWILFSTIGILVIFLFMLINSLISTLSIQKQFLLFSVILMGLSVNFVSFWYVYEKSISLSENVFKLILTKYYELKRSIQE